MPEGMSPDQRDRLVRLETDYARFAKDLEVIREVVTRLDRQSQWVRGGLILIVAVGGVATFAIDMVKRLFP